MLIIPKLRY
ncbi:uncharacterized protein FRV6_14531 [Fusarium oxysporum]|uniref:Uncharacterized protein n=1 Tax=Fusarium oxysporum TaxID=5507 RepID=A0A2H3TP32_FUSOX|nr:uncharacterized protein FRV6_14531 [Fusarium oxysporum]